VLFGTWKREGTGDLNILILNCGWGWGGLETHTLTLAAALSRKGHKVVVGCPRRGAVIENAAKYGITSRDVEVVNSGDIFAMLKIISLVSKEGVDIVIANLGKEYWPAAIAAKLTGRKIMFVRHQADRLKKITCTLIARHVDKVVAVSDAVREALLKSGVPDRKIAVIHNAVDRRRFDPSHVDRAAVRRNLGFAQHDVVVGTAGKLHIEKGVFDLLHAAEKLAGRYPALKLLYAGEGAERAALEQEATRLSVRERVVFTGRRNDMERIYASMDIFVLPSTCREAFGMAIIEAMAMGRPVIATATGGIPEIVKDNVNGILIEPGDTAGLAGAISLLIDDEQLSARIAAGGLSTVSGYFAEETFANAFEKVIEEVLGLQ
jgi:glycosyltransferase involved in cell wall biosynthesis